MFSSDPKRPLVRMVAALAGLAVMARGLAGLAWRGTWQHTNRFGESVFAPFAIVLGLAVILSALLKPKMLGRPAFPRKR
jgi:formate-dependent nitrite reductase membrane component NrfD